MNSKFLGFTAVSDKVHVFTPSPDSPASGRMRNSDTAPTTVLICTWGDGSTKHIAKYIDGYRTLYPAARIVLAQSTMYESMFHTVEKHNKNMLPLLETLFRPEDPEKDCESASSRTLVHIMSNSGGLSFVSSIMAYQNLPPYQRKQPFPHVLLVCDSTPGGLTFGEVVSRASRAMAIATSSWVPLPIDAMHGVWAVVMFITLGMSRLVLGGREMGWTYAEAIQDPKLTSPKTTRLYLYSKADELVSWEELEKNVAVAQGKGYNCIVERFEKSPHVGHAHMYPERYWGAVAKAWETAIVNQGKSNGRIGERGRL